MSVPYINNEDLLRKLIDISCGIADGNIVVEGIISTVIKRLLLNSLCVSAPAGRLFRSHECVLASSSVSDSQCMRVSGFLRQSMCGIDTRQRTMSNGLCASCFTPFEIVYCCEQKNLRQKLA